MSHELNQSDAYKEAVANLKGEDSKPKEPSPSNGEHHSPIPAEQASDEAIKRRDGRRHGQMSAAQSTEDWEVIGDEFTDNYPDIRPGVFKRFLDKCPEDAFASFQNNFSEQLFSHVINEPNDAMLWQLYDLLVGDGGKVTDEVRNVFVTIRAEIFELPVPLAGKLGIAQQDESLPTFCIPPVIAILRMDGLITQTGPNQYVVTGQDADGKSVSRTFYGKPIEEDRSAAKARRDERRSKLLAAQSHSGKSSGKKEEKKKKKKK